MGEQHKGHAKRRSCLRPQVQCQSWTVLGWKLRNRLIQSILGVRDRPSSVLSFEHEMFVQLFPYRNVTRQTFSGLVQMVLFTKNSNWLTKHYREWACRFLKMRTASQHSLPGASGQHVLLKSILCLATMLGTMQEILEQAMRSLKIANINNFSSKETAEWKIHRVWRAGFQS